MRKKPIIGITADRIRGETGFDYSGIIERYSRAITNVGGLPVIIPVNVPVENNESILAILDGILFSGGGDVDPRFYGSPSHPKLRKVMVDRDEIELELAKTAVLEGKPFLGICRGMQVINVALGGGLYADIQEQHPGAIKHDYYPGWPRDHAAHPITIEKQGRLWEIIDVENIEVNSLHHQAISELAPELESIGHAPDGIIEAVELRGHPFGLAVQWHPEWMMDVAEMMRIFSVFVSESNRQY